MTAKQVYAEPDRLPDRLVVAILQACNPEALHALDAEVYQQSIELNQGYLEAMTGQRDTSKVCIRPSQCSGHS